MNDVMIVVSAGSKYVGTSVVCTPHVTWVSGAAPASTAPSRMVTSASASVRRVTVARSGRPGARGEPAADETADQRDGPLRIRAGLLDEAVARAGKMDALDLTAGLLPGADERLRDRRRDVVVELGLSHPGRRQRTGFAGFDDAGDARLGHRRLVLEVAVVCVHQPRGVESRSVVLTPDRVAVAGQRIGDRIERHDERDRVVAERGAERAVGSDDRRAGVLVGAGLDRGEQDQLTAARAADQTDARRIDSECLRASAREADARGHIGVRGRMLVLAAL